MRGLSLLLPMALLVAGCATSSESLNFGSDGAGIGEDEALLVLAMGPNVTAGHFGFKQLNAAQSGFEGDYISLGYGAYGSADMLKRPEGEKSSFWKVQTDQINFLVSVVEPGTFVATDTSFNGFNGVSTIVNSSCRRDGAVAFDVAKGKINIARSDEVFPGHRSSLMAASHTQDTITQAFERTRANYPNVTGSVVFVSPNREARWTKADDKFLGNACFDVAENSMTLSRRGASAATSAPDEADRAAIMEALKNLENN